MGKRRRQPLTESEVETEMQAIVKEELSLIQRNKQADALLLEAITQGWSFARLRQMAIIRGKKWYFLASLSDKSLEIAGVAYLNLVTYINSQNLNHTVLEKAIAMVEYLDQKALCYANNPRIQSLLANAYDAVEEAQLQTLADYRIDIERLRRDV